MSSTYWYYIEQDLRRKLRTVQRDAMDALEHADNVINSVKKTSRDFVLSFAETVRGG